MIKKEKREGAAGASCLECGLALAEQRENRRMEMNGGWSVALENALVLRCPNGHREPGFDRIESLMRTIAAAVARKRSRLSGGEIAMLRAHLGFSGAELADHLGVNKYTVSRWENGHEEIGVTPDRLLRTIVLLHDGVADRELQTVTGIQDKGADRPIKLTIRLSSAGVWEVAKAA